MKKFILLVLCIVIVIGLVLGGITFWAVKTKKRINLNTMAASSLTTKQVALTTPKRIDISVRTAKIQIKTGVNTQLQLTNVSRDQYQVTKQAGVLRISEGNSQNHQLEIGKSPVITLTMPKETLNSLKINQLNGTLKLNDLVIDQLLVHHHNGTTLIKNLTLNDDSEIIKDNGETTINHLTVSGLKVNVKTGQVAINN